MYSGDGHRWVIAEPAVFRSKAQVPWYTVQQRPGPSQRPESGQLHGQGHPRAHRVSGCGAATPRWLVPLIPQLLHYLVDSEHQSRPPTVPASSQHSWASWDTVCSSPGLPPLPQGLLPERPSFLSAVSRLPPCLAFSWHQSPSSAPLIMTVSSSQSSAPSLQNPHAAQAVSKDMAMMVEWVHSAQEHALSWRGLMPPDVEFL